MKKKLDQVYTKIFTKRFLCCVEKVNRKGKLPICFTRGCDIQKFFS